MNVVLLTAAALIELLAVAFFVLFRKVVSKRGMPISPDVDWASEFSVDRYRPMARLLSADDQRFLEKRPGCSELARKFKAERRAIFRDYLRWVTNDFELLFSTVQAMMLASGQDRPDLAAALIRHKLRFTCAMLAVRARLVLHAMGLGAVDASALVGSLNSLFGQLQQLTPAVQSAAAAC